MNFIGVWVLGVWVSGDGVLLHEISLVENADHVVRCYRSVGRGMSDIFPPPPPHTVLLVKIVNSFSPNYRNYYFFYMIFSAQSFRFHRVSYL